MKIKNFEQFVNESVNEADVKYYKTITKDEWNKTPKDYKSIIKGVKYKMFLDPKMGTILAPVKVDESVNEAAMKIPKKQLTKIKNNLEDENYLPAMDDETRKTLLTMIKNFELI